MLYDKYFHLGKMLFSEKILPGKKYYPFRKIFNMRRLMIIENIRNRSKGNQNICHLFHEWW
jgi:hypothetical protein